MFFCVQVRKWARKNLQHLQLVVSDHTDNSFLIDRIVDNLKTADITKHKGRLRGTLALFLMNGTNWYDPFISSIEKLKVILPAIVTSKPTEDIATIDLLDDIGSAIPEAVWQFAIDVKVPRN